jgi:hypothetical protein
MASNPANEHEEVYQEFTGLVNMTSKQIEKWLQTAESQKVGYKEKEGEESVGHQSGSKIIHMLGKKKTDLTEDDYAHMRKVIGYIKRHSAQKPDGNVENTPWRFSLMNWGHDPIK